MNERIYKEIVIKKLDSSDADKLSFVSAFLPFFFELLLSGDFNTRNNIAVFLTFANDLTNCSKSAVVK